MDLSGPTEKPTIIYLHGFASGTGSTKARFFKEAFERQGLEIILPDLNTPSFAEMTLTSQLESVTREVANLPQTRPIVFMGSSLGGLLATLASRTLASRNLQKLILLAPGFGIASRWRETIGEQEMNNWRQSGKKSFFHFSFNKEMDLDYTFIEDFGKHEGDGLKVSVPTLVFHGVDDTTVPIEKSREFAQLNQEFVQLKELNDSHELIKTLPDIWSVTERFLQLNQTKLQS